MTRHRLNHTFVYYHRIHFPSASGQTIQVLRDYYALSRKTGRVHVLYRSGSPFEETRMRDLLKDYGAELTSSFQMHCIVDGWFGKHRTTNKVVNLVKTSETPVVIVTRTLDHAKHAISIRDKFGAASVMTVILELHETAIPHIVHQEQNQKVKAFFSLRKERKIFTEIDGLLCTAPPQLTMLDQIFPNHAPAVVLPNQHDAKFQCPTGYRTKSPDQQETDTGQKNACFHIRYAGQFSSWKNTDIMFDALTCLPDNIVLDIAGGKLGDGQATEAMLMKKARSHGIQDRVRYFGFLPPAQVPAFLSKADCLILPLGNNVQSRVFTSPMKLFEYAASGVPMVVTRQPTTSSLIREGVHALMVKPHSPQEIAQAVKTLSTNKGLARDIAENAKNWVDQYSPDKRVENYEKFLLSLTKCSLS